MMKHPIGFRFVLASAILLTLLSSCGNSNRCYDFPCSSSQILMRLAEARNPIPVYVPNAADPDVISTFYYVDNGSEAMLVTIFTSNGQKSRIARMVTSPSMGNLDGALENSREVTVTWANDSRGITCALIPGTYVDDSLQGSPYQTCLVWKSGEHWFRLYSTLPLSEAIRLVNSLEKVR